MIKRFLLKAILMGIGIGESICFAFLKCCCYCNVVGRSIAQGYQLCNYWQEAGRTMNYLICRAKGSLRHRKESEGLLLEPTINYPSAKIIFIYALWFWGGSVMKALFGWSNQGQQTNSEQKENCYQRKYPFLGPCLIISNDKSQYMKCTYRCTN